MYFDISDFSTEELIALSRAGSYLGVLPTEKHSSEELQELLEGTVGRMNFGLKVTGDYRDPESCKVYFAVNTSTLSDKYEAGIALAQEILLQTKFDEKDKLKEIAAQNYENDKLFCVRRGNGLGITEALGGFGARGVATEAVSGYTAMKYGSRLAQDFDNTVPSMLDAFARLRECFNTARLVVSLSSDVCPDAADIISAFPAGSGCKGDAPRAVSIPEKSGIPIPAQIGFAASGWNFRQAGYEYDGSMAVASNILSLDYLWNVVRVRGGAYGAGMSAGRSGNMQTYSYRDPSPAATRNVTAAAGDYLREYVANTDSIVKYIISTIADTEPLVSPRIVGSIGDDNWFQHVSAEDLRRERSQILAADKAGLLKFAELCDKMAAGRRECVVAFRDALEAQKDLEIMELA